MCNTRKLQTCSSSPEHVHHLDDSFSPGVQQQGGLVGLTKSQDQSLTDTSFTTAGLFDDPLYECGYVPSSPPAQEQLADNISRKKFSLKRKTESTDNLLVSGDNGDSVSHDSQTPPISPQTPPIPPKDISTLVEDNISGF